MHRRFLAIGCLLLFASIAPAQDALPDGAVARIGQHRLCVEGAISSTAFSPDGRTLVVAFAARDNQPSVVLFDVATGLERKRLNIRGAKLVAIARNKPHVAVDSP